MFSLSNLPKYCLAAIVLGGLSLTGLPSSQSLQHTETPPPDPSSHRGSGRVVTQVPQFSTPGQPYSYRGTGRLHQGNLDPVAHRGSGRVNQDGQTPPTLSYRGSRRVAPSPMPAVEWA